jgi:membrane-bound metal-dependent hydrolase YbcI (DUF457 family)
MGIPGLASYYFQKRIDVFSAVVGGFSIDIDFFLFLLFGTPVHGFLHSYIGAAIWCCFVTIFVLRNQKFVNYLKVKFNWERGTNVRAIFMGAFIGTYTHVFLDMFLYSDMSPFYPFSGNIFLANNNPIIVLLINAIGAITMIIFLIILIFKYNENKRIK